MTTYLIIILPKFNRMTNILNTCTTLTLATNTHFLAKESASIGFYSGTIAYFSLYSIIITHWLQNSDHMLNVTLLVVIFFDE